MAKRRSVPVNKPVDVRPVSARKGELLTAENRYDAASDGRRMRSWSAPGSGPRTAMGAVQKVRNRSRDAVRNEWQAASAMRIKVAAWVGTGIVPRPRTKSERRKKKLTALWDEWTPFADADGALDYYGMQSLGARARSEGGEIFIRARYRRMEDALPVPIQFQLLEPEMLPLLDADTWPGLPQNHKIRQGIERDRRGRRIAYWFYKEHPGDRDAGDMGLVRVMATDVYHVYVPLRPGQLRGVPDSAPGLAHLRVVTDYDDAVLARQHTANLYTGFIKRPLPGGDGDIDPETGKAIEYDDTGAPSVSLEPGTMQELAPGEEVVFADPPDAGTKYAEFIRWQNLGVAAAEGVPYELMTGDLLYIQDRVLRIVVNEFRRQCEQHQWQILIPGLCRWVRAKWAEQAFLAGRLTEREMREALDTEWAPHAWPYMHPTQDVQARQMEVDAGFRSRSSVVAERGDDPLAVDAERAEDAERERAAGLVSGTARPGGAPPARPRPERDEDEEEDEEEERNANE